MYKKNQHIRAHKAAQNKLRQANHFESQQGIDKRSAQDTRYTPTPVPNHPGSVIARSRLDSDNRNWILLDGDPGVERHSPDSALTASSNGSNPSFHRGGVGGGGGGLGGGEFSAPSKFRRSQSIPNLSEPSPSFPLEQLSRTISGSPETQRTSSLSKSGGPRPQVQGPSDVHRGPFVRVKVGPYDDHDADRGVVESSSLVRNKYRSEPNLFNPKANEPVPRNENRQPFSVRTFEMKKTLGMFGFVLSCKYVLNDAMVPRELRSFPRIDTATVEGVAYRSGVRHGHFVLEINGQSAELSSLTRCTSLLQLGGHHLRMKIASNHLTNDPISDNKQGPKSTTGNNFSRDLPSSDLPRHRVCYRESALQKRLMSSRPQQRMKRASSTPNLADDDQNHIYEELAEPTRSPPPPLPKVVVVESTPAPQTDSGRRGSDLSVGGTRSVVGVRQKTPGKPDSVQKHPMRSDNAQENIGREGADRRAISRTTSVDFPPSPPPRPFTDRIVAPPEKPPGQRGPYPPPMRPGGVHDGDDAKSNVASVEMKISPGVGIASIVASAASSSSASAGVVTPVTFSSFTGPFKDDVSDVRVAPSARLPSDSGVALEEEEDGRRSRGFLTMMMTGSAMDVSRMQTARNGRRMVTPVVPRYTGNDASVIGGSHVDIARIQMNGPGGNIPVSRPTGNDTSIGGTHTDITGTQIHGRGGNIPVSHNTGKDTSIGGSHIDISGIKIHGRGGNMPMSGHTGNQRRIAASEGTGNTETAGVRNNTFEKQISAPHRGRETPMSEHPGTTSRKMSVEDSGSNVGTSGSRNDVFGAVVAEFGSASRFPGNNYGPSRNREIPEIRATSSGANASGFPGGKSEFPLPQSLPEGPKTAPIRTDEPLSLLDAIRQHPLMRNDRLTSNRVDPHSTVASASHETNARHWPQLKVHPPIPPPPKPKTYKTEIPEGSSNRYSNPDSSTSLSQEPNTHGITLRVKNSRPTNQDFSKNNDTKAAQTEGAAAIQCIPKPPQRPAIGPQITKVGGARPQKGDFLLTKSGLKYRIKEQDPRHECEAPVELRNPRHRTRNESHPPQVLRLDGVTVDQSYSEDNHTRDGRQIQRTVDGESDEPEPNFRFDFSTGRLLLSDATVDQSSTESDALMPLLPPPPSMDFTPEFRLSQLPLQDVSWSSGFGSSSRTFSSPFNDRSISANSESVFLEDVASPPPPVFFIDPVEIGSSPESKHQSEHPVAPHPPSNPPAIPPRTNQPVSPQETVITKPSGVRRRPPPLPITEPDEENRGPLDSNHGISPVVNNTPTRPQKLYSNPETVIPRPSEIGTNSPQTAGDPGSVLLPPMFNNTPSRPPKLQSDSKTIIPGRSEIGKISTQTAEDPGSVPLPPAEFQNTSFNTIPQLSRPPDPPSKNHPGSVPLPPTEFHNTSADTMPKPSTPSRPPDRPPSKNHPGIVPLPPPSTNHPGNTSADTMPQPSRPYRPVTPQPSKQHRPPDPPSSTNHPGRANGEVATRDRVPSEGSVTDWSSSDVADWLRQVGQGRHAVSFQSHGVDGPRLTAMTRRDLIDLGVTAMTDRRDIERGVIRLRSLQST